MSTPNVVVVGSLNMDIVIETARLPLIGETIHGDKVSFLPGGKGANQTVAAAKLGANTAIIGAVGGDAFGSELKSSLTSAGADIGSLKTVEGTSTGTASILLVEGDNCIVVVAGANAHCSQADIDLHKEVVAAADIVLLQLEIPFETVYYAAQTAKAMGKKVILNPAPARPLPEELLKLVDYITPNESELRLIANGRAEETVEQLMQRLLDSGVGSVVATLGADGAAFAASGGGTTGRINGHVVPVVDTTGAGDCFNAALAVALAGGSSLEEAVRYAIAASAQSVTKYGAQNGMPTAAELEAFLTSQN